MATDSDVSPSAREIAQAAIAHSMAGGKPGSSGSAGGSSSSGSGSGSGSNPTGSGSEGSGSGGSGNTSSGSGHHNSGGGGGGKSVNRKLLVAFVIIMMFSSSMVAIAMAWHAFASSTKEGREHLIALQGYQDKQNQREHDEKMVKEQARLARISGATAKSAPVISATQPTTPTACINPANLPTSTRINPIILKKGECLVRDSSSENFWVTFTSAPTSISGRLGFNELVPETASDGTTHLRQAGFCLTKDSPDNCMLYLKLSVHNPPEYPSATLSVTNGGGPIQINL